MSRRFGPFATSEARERARHNLPEPITPLVGRDAELAAVRERLLRPEVRLLTLTGPGGTGKTRLALAVATELPEMDQPAFADGILLVDLAALHDVVLVLPSIAETLGLRERTGESLLATLSEFLRDRRLLLVLDNFEHLVAAAPDLASLLAASRGLRLLVTSRTALGVYGEHQFQVRPLQLPDLERSSETNPATLAQVEAVALFLQRAQAAHAEFQPAPTDLAVIAAICVHLDGLPLAIELAAARTRVLPPTALLARLNRRLELLIGGPRDLPSRQQTLRNAIDWSYQLLTEPEQVLFRRLAVFSGGFTLESAEAVCTSPLPVVEGSAHSSTRA